MPFDPTKPANGTPANSLEMRNQLNALKALVDAAAPIGSLKPWLKSFPNTPALTAHWAECNGQVLNDVESPYHGMALPNINGAGGGTQRFLRGATASGATGGAEQHDHAVDDNAPVRVIQQGTDFGVNASGSLPSFYEVVWVMRVR